MDGELKLSVTNAAKPEPVTLYAQSKKKVKKNSMQFFRRVIAHVELWLDAECKERKANRARVNVNYEFSKSDTTHDGDNEVFADKKKRSSDTFEIGAEKSRRLKNNF